MQRSDLTAFDGDHLRRPVHYKMPSRAVIRRNGRFRHIEPKSNHHAIGSRLRIRTTARRNDEKNCLNARMFSALRPCWCDQNKAVASSGRTFSSIIKDTIHRKGRGISTTTCPCPCIRRFRIVRDQILHGLRLFVLATLTAARGSYFCPHSEMF